MFLSARILSHVADVNTFEHADTAEFTEGDATYIYFQLVDASVDRAFSPPFRRYIPAAGATLMVKLKSVDSAKTVERTATMAFSADDRSVWKLQILATDAIVGTRDMYLTLTEGLKVTRGVVKQAVSVHSQTGSI